jgi:transcriptional regulator with XRE-family HTH domain
MRDVTTEVTAAAAAVGANVRRLRGAMPVAELARLVGLSRVQVWRIESGKRLPSADSLVRLARALGLPHAGYLLVPPPADGVMLPRDLFWTYLTLSPPGKRAAQVLVRALGRGGYLELLADHTCRRCPLVAPYLGLPAPGRRAAQLRAGQLERETVDALELEACDRCPLPGLRRRAGGWSNSRPLTELLAALHDARHDARQRGQHRDQGELEPARVDGAHADGGGDDVGRAGGGSDTLGGTVA